MSEGNTITLTNDVCAIRAVSNLPGRALWTEKGKPFQCCYGAANGIVVLYCDDRSVTVLPASLFRLVKKTAL